MIRWNSYSRKFGLLGLVSLMVSGGVLPAAEDGAAITISKLDFLPDRAEVLEEARELTALAPTLNGSADYARRYQRLQRDAARARPGVSEWPVPDRETLQSVPAPTEAAKAALAREEREAAERQEKRAAETEAAWAQRQANAAEQRRQELAAQRAATAARETEARAREAEDRARAYDGYGSYPYLGAGWAGHWPRPRPTPLPPRATRQHLGNGKYIEVPGPVRGQGRR